MNCILTKNKVILIIILLGVFIVFGACSSEDRPYDRRLVLTVDTSKVYLDEMMYHVMIEEMYGQLYASYIGDNEDYWTRVDEAGIPMKDLAKESVLENAIRYELFYLLALEQGYSLTDEEKLISKSQADNIKMSVPPEQLELTQLTDEKLIAIQEKILLARRFYDNYLVELEIDEHSIGNLLNPDDYKQYDIEYIYSNKYDKISDLLEPAQSSKNIASLATGSELNTGKLSFVKGKNTFGDEENLENIILSMEIGEVSDIIETVKGYYIIKLTDNASKTLYNEAVKESMNAATITIFEPAYENLKNSHKIKLEKNVWKQIEMGSQTIPNT